MSDATSALIPSTEHDQGSTVVTGISPRRKFVRRAVVGTVGFSILFAGLLMMVLPGPGIVTVLAGISVLATEFAWAKKLKVKAVSWIRSKRRKSADDTAEEGTQ